LNTSSVTGKKLFITRYDMVRLRALLRAIWPYHGKRTMPVLSLVKELDQAIVVPPADIPADVITINSQFLLRDLSSDEGFVYTLVFPKRANIEQGMISVLSPIGAAAIGHSVGDIFEFKTPIGIARMKVKRVFYQPESSGDYYL
jgi:regulator of nucleoside diphosphate kinase